VVIAVMQAGKALCHDRVDSTSKWSLALSAACVRLRLAERGSQGNHPIRGGMCIFLVFSAGG
jgi:uncharacterized membrane protein